MRRIIVASCLGLALAEPCPCGSGVDDCAGRDAGRPEPLRPRRSIDSRQCRNRGPQLRRDLVLGLLARYSRIRPRQRHFRGPEAPPVVYPAPPPAVVVAPPVVVAPFGWGYAYGWGHPWRHYY